MRGVGDFVIDSLVLLAWLLPDEVTSEAHPLFSRLTATGAHAPVLLRYEVTNVLVNAERRGRISAAYRAGALLDFQLLPIRFEVPLHPASMPRVAELAAAQRLSAYDAAYLALAMDLGLPLASADRELTRAAALLGVSLL